MTFSSFRAEANEPIPISFLIVSVINRYDLWWRSSLRGRNFGVCDAGQVPFRREHRLLVSPVEIRAIDGSTQVGQKHPAAFQIQGDTDSFHQMVENNHRLFLVISLGR